MEYYAAGIVLYNPDIMRLKENLDAVSSQVQKVYCFNNGLKDSEEIAKLFSGYDNVYLIGEGKNVGIATALNELVKQSDKDNVEWLLTLDQDSVVCDRMIEKLAFLKKEKNVAIICPIIEDVRRKNEEKVIVRNTYEDVDFCITSGSFMNVKKTIEIGGFDDWLFIGLVDDEICYRVKINGYRIIRNNNVTLNHELGNLTPSRFEKFYLKFGDLLHSESVKKLSYKREVSPMRLYYATRNMVYLNRKYSDGQYATWSKKRIIKNSISSVLRGKQKGKLIKSIINGIRDGKFDYKKESIYD